MIYACVWPSLFLQVFLFLSLIQTSFSTTAQYIYIYIVFRVQKITCIYIYRYHYRTVYVLCSVVKVPRVCIARRFKKVVFFYPQSTRRLSVPRIGGGCSLRERANKRFRDDSGEKTK